MKARKPKSKDKPRFNEDALRELAGPKIFARGMDYFAGGAVQLLAVEQKRVLASVSGTDDYRVELSRQRGGIGGECSCPAFEDWGFCKHMVATALAANEAGADSEGAGTLPDIRAYLKAKGTDTLVEMIVEMAERDPALFRKLDLAAAATGANDKTLEARLRKALDAAARTGGFVDWREAATWAAGVEEVLDAIGDLVPGPHAGLALNLAERAIERVEDAIEEIDDSNGHCEDLLTQAREIHLAAARALKPEPRQLARNLFAREMADGYGTFHGAMRLYADVLGKRGLAEYRRLAAAAWEKLPPRPGGSKDRYEFSFDYARLMDILDFFAEHAGDTDARIALRAKDLSSPWLYCQLVEFCVSQGRETEALTWAEEGLWLFEDSRVDERLLFLTLDLLSKAGRKSDAEAHLWRAFEQSPNLEFYKRLSKLGGKPARGRAVKFLEARIGNKQASQWHFPADLLIRVLIEEKQFEAAWVAVHRHGTSLDVREALAMKSEAAHPRDALEVYAERVAQLANGGGNQAYEEAAKLVARMARLGNKEEHVAYLTQLKARFGRKRNFMKLLG
jgi:uncharacterized Zn finger protein